MDAGGVQDFLGNSAFGRALPYITPILVSIIAAFGIYFTRRWLHDLRVKRRTRMRIERTRRKALRASRVEVGQN